MAEMSALTSAVLSGALSAVLMEQWVAWREMQIGDGDFEEYNGLPEAEQEARPEG